MVEQKSKFACSDLKEDLTGALNKVKAGDALDLCIILDITASMGKWIQRSKATITTIIDNIMKSVFAKAGLFIRISFVGYRDIGDKNHFAVKNFTEDVQALRNFIGKQIPNGGIDYQEDVSGGLKKCLEQDWDKTALKQAVLICDAPEHGEHFLNDLNDRFKEGTPNEDTVESIMHEMAEKQINFTVCRLDDTCDQMIAIMEQNYCVKPKEEDPFEKYDQAVQKLEEEEKDDQPMFDAPVYDVVDVVSHIKKNFPDRTKLRSVKVSGFDKEARGNMMQKGDRFEETKPVPLTPGQLRIAKEESTDKFFIKRFTELLLQKLRKRKDRRVLKQKQDQIAVMSNRADSLEKEIDLVGQNLSLAEADEDIFNFKNITSPKGVPSYREDLKKAIAGQQL